MDKKFRFEAAQSHLVFICGQLAAAKIKIKGALLKRREKLKRVTGGDRIVEERLKALQEKRLNELEYLVGSPYFVRCDVQNEGEEKVKSFYFGKFEASEERIYSWVVPASSIRFEAPGAISYIRPDGSRQKGELKRKDQFVIANGQIKFMASESLGEPRELVYQDYFSSRKTGFVLPEILAEMEKKQDQVIRAEHSGPFVISGPAGSGKTTLALHRVAYLLQSPDLADYYTGESIIVFVQDQGTKKYFSALLPGLGIDNVKIVTFAEWALGLLEINAGLENGFGSSENERDLYLYAKLKAVKEGVKFEPAQEGDHWSCLFQIYKKYFDERQLGIMREQKLDNKMDYVDLTALLMRHRAERGALGEFADYYAEDRNGNLKKKNGYVVRRYSLIVIDEFQNYLPEQLDLMKSTINTKHSSIVYVGDMAQQVKLGTIKDFDEISESISKDRRAVLEKVYRNTKSILRYIKSLGYKVAIPESLPTGKEVGEFLAASKADEIAVVKGVLKEKKYSTVGILAKSNKELSEYYANFARDDRVHIMTISEAQGVEFDIVFIVGLKERTFFADYHDVLPRELAEEKKRIDKDLLYVALTRAISELYVVGEVKLSEICLKK